MTQTDTSTTPQPASQAAGHLSISQLVKIYDSSAELRAVDEVSLDVAAGEFITLLGPSGCGKTTILRTIAGFEAPTSGSLRLDGADLAAQTPSRRPVSMVFQSYALFPHMTVWENVAYGLKAHGIRGRSAKARVAESLAMMGLDSYADRAPAQLSGGQQQRVALARAMVIRPQVMLFDEPLSNLDAALRDQMRFEIRRIQRELGTTAVYVTHDQSEAMAMSDRVVVLNQGRVEQIGTPAEIYRRPASRFVAGFVGRANFLPAQGAEWDQGRAGVVVLGRQRRVAAHPEAASAPAVELLVRPESLQLSPAEDHDDAAATVTATVFMGDRVEYELDMHGARLLACVMDPAESQIIPEGTGVQVDFREDRAWLLPADPGMG